MTEAMEQELSTIAAGGRRMTLRITIAGRRPLLELKAQHFSAAMPDAELLFDVLEARYLRGELDRFISIATKEK